MQLTNLAWTSLESNSQLRRAPGDFTHSVVNCLNISLLKFLERLHILSHPFLNNISIDYLRRTLYIYRVILKRIKS